MSRKRAGWLAVLTTLGVALAACAGTAVGNQSPSAQSRAASPDAGGSGGSQALTITTGDYYFRPDEIRFRPGPITLTVYNEGPRRHTFFVRNLADTDDIHKGNDRFVAGESETVTFTLPEEGRYKMYCAIPGHADRGELGWIIISRS